MKARGFRSIVGHKDVIQHFQTAIAHGRISHAYLITGEPGSGKRMMAEAFAQALMCGTVEERLRAAGVISDTESAAQISGGTATRQMTTEQPVGSAGRNGEVQSAASAARNSAVQPSDIDACLTCLPCRKALDHNHPDILYITHEKPNVISVGEIRTQLVNTVDILPYESRYKIYIIPDAEKMNPQAQNALLKTIEEPPEYVVILLLTSSPVALLPTVHSRCVTLDLKPIPDADISDYLARERSLPDYEVKVLTAFAQGNLGRAVSAADDEVFNVKKDRTLNLLKSVHEMDSAAILEVVRLIKEDRDEIGDVFDIMRIWFRDVLLYKATADVDQIIFSNELSAVRSAARSTSYEGLQDILDAIDRCQIRLNANVNFDLALELLLFTIKENYSS